MKKKPLFIATFLAAGLGALILGIASAQAAPQVLIGFVLPLTNSSAETGKQIRLGAEIAAEEINRKGGVASLGGATLELIIEDSETNPSVWFSATERLITETEVSVLCGAYNSFVTFPATHLAENGAPIRLIQALLGHASLAITSKYLRIPDKKIKTEHKKTHPSNRRKLYYGNI